jgi:acetyl coenzyme A synthetase (ADP forming)-like protein
MAKLDYFFTPKSVAVIGVSRNTKKVGHVIFRNFVEGGFKGKLYPVNPKVDEILGYKSYPSVLKIPGKIDLAVISIPAPIVPKIMEECGKKGISAVIIITGGFKEIGRKDLEDDVIKVLKKYRIRVIGPNCVGVFDPYSEVDTFFLPKYKLERPGKGDIAFISQSGALGSVVLDWMSMKGYKISKFISYGNAADVDEADLIDYLSNDDKTKVICAYFEGVKQGRKFYEIASKVTGRKPVIALKGGKTAEGNNAVSSHTGSLAGQAEIYSAAFRQSGVIEAESLEEIFDFARVLSTQPVPKGNRVQVITDGGGFGVLATDWIIKNGLKLAKMKPDTIKRMRNSLPNHVVLKNPIDLTGDANVGRYKVAMEAAVDDDNVDMIVVITLFQIPTLTAEITDVISSYAERSDKPIIVIAAGGRFTEVLKKSMEDFGIPTFSYPEKAARALRALYDYSCARKG